MNPIKLIVTDMDRTLLQTDKTISPYTAAIFRQAKEWGVMVAFATARPKRSVVPYFKDVQADACIIHNGAAIYLGEALLSHRGIPPRAARDILLSISRDYPAATLSIEIDDVFYANFDVSAVWNNAEAIRTDFTDLPLAKPAEKLIVGVSSMDDIQRYAAYLPKDLYIEMSDRQLGLIMHREATKFNGIKTLAAHLNIPLNQIAAFGDDYNDIQMLKGCGIGVAMGNALEEAKAAADAITLTHDQDGVAKWLEQNLL